MTKQVVVPDIIQINSQILREGLCLVIILKINGNQSTAASIVYKYFENLFTLKGHQGRNQGQRVILGLGVRSL